MIYLVPDYYDRFACKCGDCRTPCCEGWRVSVSESEYFRLVGMDCPPDIRVSLDEALHVYDDATPIRYAELGKTWTGDCHLHGSDGLCALQVACGESVLPDVCRMYPRSVEGGEVGRMSCSNSCEGVVELLVSSPPFAVKAEERPLRPEIDVGLTRERAEKMLRRIELFRAGDASCGERIAALGAEFGMTRPRRDDDVLDVLTEMCATLGEVSASVRPYCEAARSRYADRAAYFNEARAFDAAYPYLSKGAENIFANHMLETCYPYDGRDERAAYTALVAQYALVRFMTVANVAAGVDLPWSDTGRPVKARPEDVIAAAFRMIEHTNFRHNATLILGRLNADDVRSLSALLAV